ncbi:hypothetical protein BDR26DRAFT_317961 [Obelidium mucronatum]|nr:hypothetical protein BDR26DRAFT_317961 [Obelidium mucronatum]
MYHEINSQVVYHQLTILREVLKSVIQWIDTQDTQNENLLFLGRLRQNFLKVHLQLGNVSSDLTLEDVISIAGKKWFHGCVISFCLKSIVANSNMKDVIVLDPGDVSAVISLLAKGETKTSIITKVTGSAVSSTYNKNLQNMETLYATREATELKILSHQGTG